MKKVGAIVLAAGKGSRMKSENINKVALVVNNKPLILRTIEKIEKAGISEIVVVVGFAKESVINVLPSTIKYAVQNDQLGTGDAEKSGLTKISPEVESILSVYGDDSFLYSPEVFKEMINVHTDSKAAMTLATVIKDDPTGLGRIVRNKEGKIERIVEELNATDEERKIREVNTGCYLFDRKLLDENITKIKKNELKGEFYLTDIIEIFVNNKYPISSIRIPQANWKGVNTPEELEVAKKALQENEEN